MAALNYPLNLVTFSALLGRVGAALGFDIVWLGRRPLVVRSMRFAVLCLVVTVVVGASWRLALAQSPAAAGATIAMKDFEFSPKEIKIKVGQSITWTNNGNAAHSATAIDKSFNTRNLQPGESKSVTFSTPGVFAYHCVFHGNPDDKSGMTGTVVVEP